MRKKIFIVEDEMILNEQLKRFLEKYDYSVEVFPHGESCIAKLYEGESPDLILMDINLGKGRMNGPTVTKEIYKKYDIPVVLHSAYTDKATLDTTRDMTKYGYIQKVPGNEHFILATIEMALKLHSTEKELKRRENLYRELFENSNDGIYLHRIQRDGTPGKFIEVNRIACNRLGYSREELLCMSPRDLDTKERQKDIPQVMNELFEQGNCLFEMYHTTKNGGRIPVEINAHLFRLDGEPLVLSAVRDITQRKEAEEQLKRSEEFYRTILGSISDTVLLTDDEGRFVYVCPNIEVIFGYTEHEVKEFLYLKKLLGSPVVPSERLREYPEIKNMRLKIVDKWKERHVLLVNIKKVAIGGGTRLYTFRDITELSDKEEALKQSERMYRELSAHLQQVREEQNAELSREIHDDLGQALTAIRMNITFMEETLEEEGVNKEDLRRTVGDMQRIADNTVKKVRRISTELRPSVIDTEGIIEAIEWQVEEFRENFNISVEITSEKEDIELGSEKSLHVFRIVQESLTNCIRHSRASRVDVSIKRDGEVLNITVSDDGQGFDIRTVDKDSGFGLIGMRERAKQCGGSLRVESTHGEGTELQLKIPIAK